MEKRFFEVFPKLLIEEELRELIEDAKVTRVTSNPEKTRLRIYMNSEQWIHKKHVYFLEQAIRDQFFAGIPMEVKIIEKFELLVNKVSIKNDSSKFISLSSVAKGQALPIPYHP